jgi:hypothetical protein
MKRESTATGPARYVSTARKGPSRPQRLTDRARWPEREVGERRAARSGEL